MKHKYTAREYFILLLCGVTAFIVVAGTFYIYGSSQNRQFELMEKETQTKSAMLQSQKIQTTIAQLEGRLAAISEMVIASGLDPESEWLEQYLIHTGEKEPLIHDAVFVSMETLHQNLNQPGIPDEAEHTYKTLMDGGRVYSEIIYSKRLSDYFFGIAEPVQKDGSTIGAIRCTIPASELVQRESLSMLPLPEHQFIVDSDGMVLFSYGSLDLTGSSMFEFLEEEYRYDQKEDSKLRQGVQNDETITVSVGGYFITSTSLSLHHWNLIQFSSKGSMQGISHKLLFSTVILCLIIILILTGMVFVMVKSIDTKNNSIAFQQSKTASLATVLDVLLLEYHPAKDQMILTPGDNCDYALDNLSITKCREYPFDSIHPDDIKIIRGFIANPKATTFELRIRGADGQWLWSECRMLSIAMSGKGISYAGKVLNVHERKMRELQLMEENIRDRMTGLMNRTALKEYVTMLLDGKTAGFFFMIDIDNFKSVNDTHGHAAGDEIICLFSKILIETFRESDLIGRVGGDEFVVYMAGTRSEKLAAVKAKNILDSLFHLSEKEGVVVSASIGIAHYPDDGSDYEELLGKSDKAMYNAKNSGKNNYTFC